MFRLFSAFKKLFFPKFKTLELVDNLRENTNLTNDQTNMLGNLLKLGKIQVVGMTIRRNPKDGLCVRWIIIVDPG